MTMDFQDWLKAHYVKSGFISSTDELRAAWDAAVAAEREPANLIFNALLVAAWDAPGNRTAGEMRSAAVTLFGESAVNAALARMKA
jgi:hypothetical protein